MMFGNFQKICGVKVPRGIWSKLPINSEKEIRCSVTRQKRLGWIYKTVKKSRKRYLKGIIEYTGPILAPIKKDDVVGKFKIYNKDELIDEYDLYASEDINKVNIFSRIWRSVNYLIWGDV